MLGIPTTRKPSKVPRCDEIETLRSVVSGVLLITEVMFDTMPMSSLPTTLRVAANCAPILPYHAVFIMR